MHTWVCFSMESRSWKRNDREKRHSLLWWWFGYGYNNLAYSATDENVKMIALPSFNDDSFDIGLAADVLVCVSRKAKKSLTQELLTFLKALTLMAWKLRKGNLVFVQVSRHLRKNTQNNYNGLHQRFFFVTYQSQRDTNKDQKFVMQISVNVLEK